MGSEAANNAATDAANASAGVGDGGGPGGGDSGDTGGPFRDGGRVGLYDGGSAFDNYRALNFRWKKWLCRRWHWSFTRCCRNLFRIQS
jgi:hypothetical protein